MRLVGDLAAPRLVTTRTGQDHTERMIRWAGKRVAELEREGLSGFIFKSRSPSSGMGGVKVYDRHGMPSGRGSGLFARIFQERFSLTPVEDEGRLHDPAIRENFIERVFVFRRWRELEAVSLKRGLLIEFHTRHKLLILAHSPKHLTELGRLMAGAGRTPVEELRSRYLPVLMEALKLKATVQKHTNVLQHIMGYFRRQLTPDERQELVEIVSHYHEGLVPLIVPVTLLNHHVRKYREPYLLSQYYLNPHPLELKLRNHV
jgi:uncharacterized protein YbgA (DUF1722 family)